MSGYGYAASLQPFPFESYQDLGSLVEVTSPGSRALSTLALAKSVSGLVEAALVAAGLGRPEDFPPDSTGKVALVERGELFYSDKVQNATNAGAAAVIVYNNEPGIIAAQLREPSAIPAVTISQEDGQALLSLLQAGPVTLRVEVNAETKTLESRNVVAQPPGQDCRVVAGGHYDSVPAGPGANDNASGTAVVMEMARVLAADGQMDDVCFALFGAEEVGLLGSAHYVSALDAQARSRVRGMLNFDMLAVGDRWPLVGSAEIVQLAAQAAETLGISHEVADAPPNVGSDHSSFIDAGIPAMLFNCFCDEHYHTADDRLEFVQGERLAQAGAIGLGVIEALLRQ